MYKPLFIRLSLLTIPAMMLLLQGCASSSSEPDGERKPVTFTAVTTDGNSSRAAIGKDEFAAAGSAFKVWGTMRNDATATQPIIEFDGVNVESNGSQWLYNDLRYWFPGFYYSFRAVYPSGLTGVTFQTGTSTATDRLDIAGFDATSGRDILAASHTRQASLSGNDAVQLQFRHLLARIDIKASIDNAIDDKSITITSVRFIGFTTSGDWSGLDLESSPTGKWTLTTPDPSQAAYPAINMSRQLTSTPVSLLDGDNSVMVIPQSLPRSAKVEITYTDSDSQPHVMTADLYAATSSLPNGLEASRLYSFRLVIGPEQYILFSTPTVSQWNDVSGGNFIIQ